MNISKNEKIIYFIIIPIVFLLIALPFCLSKRIESEEKKEPVSLEEKKQQKLESKLLSMGFQDANNEEMCSSDKRCYYKEPYLVSIDSRVTISKNIEDIDDYNIDEEIKLVEEIYGDYNIHIKQDIMNNIINNYFNKGINSFTMEYYKYYLNVIYLSKKLSLIVSEKSKNEGENIYDFSTIIDTDAKNAMDIRKDFYNIIIEDNKELNQYTDFAYMHFDNDKENLCEVNYSYGTNQFNSSFCHGGTSNTYYKIDKVQSSNAIKFEIMLKGDYFEKDYKKIINNDLKYINKKTGINYSIPENIEKEIDVFIINLDDTKEEYYLGEGLYVGFKRIMNPNFRYYMITYKIANNNKE